MSKVLVLSPHPDDEILGAGGSIARHVADGDEVHVVYVTKTYSPDWSDEFRSERYEEIVQVSEILGFKWSRLCLPVLKLHDMSRKELYEKIEGSINFAEPDTVYIPWRGDINPDHRIVHEVAMSALRPYTAPTVKTILAYETLSETEWGHKPFWPNVYVDIRLHLEKKIEAMKAYASELKMIPHPRSPEGIREKARIRGSEARLLAAEAFMLMRKIIK